jgi:hypothetical protein
MPASGGTPNLVGAGEISAVTTTSSLVLWADRTTDAIYSASLDGGSVKSVVAAENVSDLRVTGDTLYWISGETSGSPFQKVSLSGGSPAEVVPAGNTLFAYLEMDATAMYAVGFSLTGAGTQLYHGPFTGDPLPPVTLDRIVPPSLDPSFVYVGSQGALNRVSRASGAVELMAALPYAFGTAVDADAAYVTVDSPTGNCAAAEGSVYRVPFDTMQPAVLASEQACPSGIAVDASGVYWVNAGTGSGMDLPDAGTGQLMRAPRL